MVEKDESKPTPVTIKKYANRRLYNTATSSYVTLDHLCQMVKEGREFVVYDAKSGEDITRAVLTQIIVEEEGKGGQNLLPIGFLRQLISFYGDNMQWAVPRYLEYTMQSFSNNQDKMRETFQNALGGMFPFGGFEEMSKQNMALLERTMRMFTPPFPGEGGAAAKPAESGDPAQARPKVDTEGAVKELQKRLDDLQNQLASVLGGKPRE